MHWKGHSITSAILPEVQGNIGRHQINTTGGAFCKTPGLYSQKIPFYEWSKKGSETFWIKGNSRDMTINAVCDSGLENTCTPVADSCQGMAKPIQCKVISLQKIKKK